MATKSNAAAAFRRNLAALNLEENVEEDTTPPPVTSATLSNYSVKQIPFELLVPNRFQSQLRPEQLDQEKLMELAQNIAVNGFTSVILVRPHPDQPGYYEVGHGHRRLAALKLATEFDIENNKVKGFTKIPARIAENVSDAEWLDIAVSENLSREDLTPLAIAHSFEAIRSQNPGISLANIARKVGRSKSWVQRYDAINGAPQYLKEMIQEKPDSLEHLFILKNQVSDKARQKELAQQVTQGQLTLAALKQLVETKEPKPATEKSAKSTTSKIDSSLSSNSATSGLINKLEANVVYLYQQLERNQFYLTFEEHDKLEQLTLQLKELVSQTRPSKKKFT